MSQSFTKGLSRADRKSMMSYLTAIADGFRQNIIERHEEYRIIEAMIEEIRLLLFDSDGVVEGFIAAETVLVKKIIVSQTDYYYAVAMSLPSNFQHEPPVGVPYCRG